MSARDFLDGLKSKGRIVLPVRGQSGFFPTVAEGFDRWDVAGVVNAGALSTGAPAIDTLFALPVLCDREGALQDRIGFNVTAVGGVLSVARVSLYDNLGLEGEPYPGNLLVDGGEKDTSAIGGTGSKLTTISRALEVGRLYWRVYHCGVSAPTIRTCPVGVLWPILGFSNTLPGNAAVGWTHAQAYGAPPAVFPMSAPSVIVGGAIPAIFGRYAS